VVVRRGLAVLVAVLLFALAGGLVEWVADRPAAMVVVATLVLGRLAVAAAAWVTGAK
jgi:hypothetical protein